MSLLKRLGCCLFPWCCLFKRKTSRPKTPPLTLTRIPTGNGTYTPVKEDILKGTRKKKRCWLLRCCFFNCFSRGESTDRRYTLK